RPRRRGGGRAPRGEPPLQRPHRAPLGLHRRRRRADHPPARRRPEGSRMTVPDIRLVPLAPGGSGHPLLVGPSLGTRAAACWGPPVPLLGDRRVSGWALPGHGGSPAARDGFSMTDLAAGILQAADAVGLGRFDAAGVSLGGLVSLALGAR